MADFKSERFRSAQLLCSWLFGIGIGCFFIMACLIIVFLAVASQSNVIVSFLALMPTLSGIVGFGAGGLFFLWASLSLRLMISIEHNTHVVSDVSMVAGRISQDSRVVR
jgi:hypothetical protein